MRHLWSNDHFNWAAYLVCFGFLNTNISDAAMLNYKVLNLECKRFGTLNKSTYVITNLFFMSTYLSSILLLAHNVSENKSLFLTRVMFLTNMFICESRCIYTTDRMCIYPLTIEHDAACIFVIVICMCCIM